MNRVCLDANIWIKFLTEEPDTELAEKLVISLFEDRKEIIAPEIMKMEVGSILRKKYYRQLIKKDWLDELWNKFLSIPIIYIHDKQLYTKAGEIAELNNLSHLYDAVYLALSKEIDFWTADERLMNSIAVSDANIKLLKRDLI